MSLKCIDVSCWQGNIDWTKVKKAGYGHAIIRAGFGREASQVDSKFETNYKNAKAAGVKLGVYWYSYAVDKADAIKEANACLTVLKGKKLDMPVYFDMEESSMTKLGKSTLTAMAKAFCDTIKKGGFTPGVYSNPNWFTNYLDYNGLKKLYSIWLAQYYKEAQLECDIWQYSSTGTVSGISGSVDMNIIYNEGILMTASTNNTATNYQGAGIQALLITARSLGLITQNITPIDNKVGTMTKAAILQMKKYLGLKEDYTITLEFIQKTQDAIAKAVNSLNKEHFETAAVQALLRDTYGIGIVQTYVTPIDNKKGKLTKAALLEAKECLGYQNPDTTVDLRFISDLEDAIRDRRAENEKSPAGDFNGDGEVNIKDATAIQKHLAGLE